MQALSSIVPITQVSNAKVQNTNITGPMGYLPNELILQIFSYLGSPKDISSFGATCEILHQLSMADVIWSSLFYKYFPFAQENSEFRKCLDKKIRTVQYNINIGRNEHKTLLGYDVNRMQFAGNQLFFVANGTLNSLGARVKKFSRDFKVVGGWQVHENFLFAGSWDNTIKIVNLKTGECLQTIEGHSKDITTLKVVENRLFTCSRDGTIKIWDLETTQCLQTITAFIRKIDCLEVAGDRLYTTCWSTIKVWDLNTAKCLQVLEGHTGAIECLQIVEDRLFTGAWDGKIKIWSLKTGTCLKTLKGHTHRVSCLHVAGNYLFAGSYDGTVKIWDLKKEKCLQILKKHIEMVPACLQFKGGRLIVGSQLQRTIEIWDFDCPPPPPSYFESFAWGFFENTSRIIELLQVFMKEANESLYS